MTRLKTGARIGILGGGQLGRMLSLAAARLGFEVSIYCPEPDCPASRVSLAHQCAAYTDLPTLHSWAEQCGVITYEFENVPVSSVEALIKAGHKVRPGALPLHISQDRLTEKTFLSESCAIRTAPFEAIDQADQIRPALIRLGGQGILKTRRDGYDGKGQIRLGLQDDLAAAYAELGHKPAILEAFIPFAAELSVILARDAEGRIQAYDCPQNHHEKGILKRSVIRGQLRPDLCDKAREAAARLVTSLDYTGVLALEFFILPDDTLIANEFAPRVHNSGHWTPEACATGQFEQHIRAIAGWPLGPVTRYHDVEMINLLGDDIHRLTDEDLHTVLTLYGKHKAKQGRKMGHLVRRLS